VRRLKHLEVENARLKKLVAERDLEIEVMKEVASKNWAWLRAVRGHSRRLGQTRCGPTTSCSTAAPTVRGAAVFGASAPRPVAPSAHIGHMQQRVPSQTSRGPKNLGRS
jgi:hypothetical protein